MRDVVFASGIRFTRKIAIQSPKRKRVSVYAKSLVQIAKLLSELLMDHSGQRRSPFRFPARIPLAKPELTKIPKFRIGEG
jgi:hypothetical protein